MDRGGKGYVDKDDMLRIANVKNENLKILSETDAEKNEMGPLGRSGTVKESKARPTAMNITDAFSFDNYERKQTIKKVVKKANVNELKMEIEKKVQKDA